MGVVTGGGGGGSTAGFPKLYGPVTLLVAAAPQSQTLWTFQAGDIIIDLWLEITSPMAALAKYEVYTDTYDFVFPQTNLDAVNSDSTRWTPNTHPGVVASITGNDTPPQAISVPSRMRATTAVTCDKTSGGAGGAGVAYALVIPA